MLRTTLLNTHLVRALSSAGHGQFVVIADAGLPCPPNVPVIDISVVPGLPGFREVTRAILAEMPAESCIAAVESQNSEIFRDLAGELAHLPMRVVTHEDFKSLLQAASVIVRTGECTPYANLAIVAGTTF